MAEAPIDEAVRQLSRLPGVGRKTATRLVYWLLRAPKGVAGEIGAALSALESGVRECERCCDFTDRPLCPLCGNTSREEGVVCVVEHPQDVRAFERTGGFRGRYHVLHGAISPLDGVGPQDLRIQPLLRRVGSEGLREVILATDPDVEGDATALYLARLLRAPSLKVTRLARGLAVGSEIEYADAASLARALENRQEMG